MFITLSIFLIFLFCIFCLLAYSLKDVGNPDELKKNPSYVRVNSQIIFTSLKKLRNTYWDLKKCTEALIFFLHILKILVMLFAEPRKQCLNAYY